MAERERLIIESNFPLFLNKYYEAEVSLGDMTKRLSILFPNPDPIPKTVKGEFQFSLIIYFTENIYHFTRIEEKLNYKMIS